MNFLTDLSTGDSPERRALREAKAGRGGGSGRDALYDPNSGTSSYWNSKTKKETQKLHVDRSFQILQF